MSHVTSAGCRLTPDDTTNMQSTTPSPTVTINMLRGAERVGDGRRENAKVNKQRQRHIDRESDS